MSIAEVTDQYNEEEGYYYEQGQDYDAETDLPAQATETDERYPPQATNTTNEQEEEEEEGLVKEDVKKEDDSTDIIPNMLFVSRFKHGSTTKEHVQELFAPYGPIKNIIVREKLAFVEYVAPEDAAKAKHAIHYGAGLGSDSLIVDFKKANGFVQKERDPNAPLRAPRHNNNHSNTGKGFHHNAANNTSNGGFNYRSDQSSRPSTASQSSYAQSSNNPSFRHQERSRQLAGYDDRRDTRGDYGDKPMAHRAEYRGAPPPAPYLEKPHIRQVDPYSREPEYARGDYDYRSTIDPYARPPQSRRGGERGPPPPPPAYDRYPSYDSRDDSRSPPPPHYPPHGLPQHPPHHVPLHHVAPHHPPPHHAPPHLGSNKRSYEDHHDFVGYSAPPPRGPPPGPRGPPMGHFPRGPPPSYDDHHIPQPRYDQRPPHPQFQSYPGPRGPPPPPPMHMGHEWNDRGGYRPPRDGPDPFPPRPRYDDRAVPPPPRGYDRGDYRPSPVDDYQTKRARY